MQKNVLIHGSVDNEKLAVLREMVTGRLTILEADMEEKGWSVPPDEVATTHCLFSSHPPINLDALAALEFWQLGSVGFTQVVGLGLPARQVQVSNARGVFDVPIGEWNLSMMINLARDLRGMIRNQESGIWDPGGRFQQEIHGATVGIWGYGGIGRETARLAKAVGMKVHVLSRNGVGPRDGVYCEPGVGDPAGALPDKVFLAPQRLEFLAGLDFLVVAMPLSPLTKGIIGAAELAALPDRAFILNPARGPIIDEKALLHALDTRQIAGAALDTHYYYPMPADHPLWRYPNVIMTPHISGSSENARFTGRIWSILIENLRRLAANEPMLNQLTAAELDGKS